MAAYAKFKNLVHYIVHECRDRPDRLGDVRLNEALWYADAGAFRKHGKPITGETYVKRRHAPVPRRIGEALDDLRREGRIAVRERSGPYGARNFISLADPDPHALSGDERMRTSEAVAAVCGVTASRIGGMTRDAIWDAAYDGEEIPIWATLAANDGEITPDVIAWANKGIERHGRGE